jgi:predicted short-subunit dehydrogenase-like oxidoreductase (DUF2520 family)
MKAVKSKKIALIGAGNVAWHLAQAFTAVGHQVVAIYSRTAESRNDLAALLPHANAVASLDLREIDANIVIIAVPDAVLATVASNLRVTQGTIVTHTSGSQPLSLLSNISGAKIGVFYPLQTFSKRKPVDLSQVPILVEADQPETLIAIERLGLDISTQVQKVNSTARKQLHLAAVFACNFTNHLLGISQQLLIESELPITLLQPLIQETISKALQQNPYNVQTGPAIRHDENVIKEHLSMLQQHPSFKYLYKSLTKSIQETNK